MTFDKTSDNIIDMTTNYPPELWVITSNIYEKLIEKGFISNLECPYGKALMKVIECTIIDTYLKYLD